ncbi:MAG TPA: aldo/keto reductase [Xanthobacteraceae bacterium]|nr:aldo/keto reductase [Xanthobacteraceae bacterium]
MPKKDVSIGLGLLSIGRRWGVHDGDPPPRREAIALLRHAVDRGVRLFDTAPAYGTSEAILGDFLRDLGAQSDGLIVATKMGEHWIEATASARADHTYDALRTSIDTSLKRLGRIDLMQVHKATRENMLTDDVCAAIAYAKKRGITTFGVSVSDVGSALMACETPAYSHIQIPFSRANQSMAPVFQAARRFSKKLLINRPYAMGALLDRHCDDNRPALRAALQFVHDQQFEGFILTGTRSADHFEETLRAFESLQ